MMNFTSSKTCCLPPSVQSKLNLRGVAEGSPRWRRPLGDVNTAMRDLDLSDEEILLLVQQRALIGFNIAVQPVGRSVTRILTHSLDHFRQTRGRTALEISWQEMFKMIFPGPQLSDASILDLPFTLTGLDLKQGLNCSRGHVENLARCYFEIVRPSRRGRGHTPVFKTGSVERWLKTRML
jgi:hypothetical protein